MGNHQVRFLGEGTAAMPFPYPTPQGRGELGFEEEVRRCVMCGRYVRKGDKQKISEASQAKPNPLELPMPDSDYNIAPTTHQPIIRESRETGEREMVLARWGLVPFFTRELSDIKGLSTINARAETITKAPAWREPFKKRRCLIPASEFYEWARPVSRPDDCPAWLRDRTCRPIGSTLGGQAER